MIKVTDPELLAQLEGQPSKRVTDPELLAQLENTTQNESRVGDPTAGNSFLQNAWIGLGSTLPNLNMRFNQLSPSSGTGLEYQVLKMRPGQERDQAVAAAQTAADRNLATTQAEIDETRRLEAPLMRTGGGVTGKAVGLLGTTAPAMAIPGANTLAGSALIGGGMGLLEPVATGESSAENAGLGMLGGGGGYGVGKALGAIATPVRSRLGDIASGLSDRARSIGIDLSPAQATGSKALSALEAAMDYLPFTSGKQAERRIGNAKAFNRKLASTFGENVDEITPQVIADAKTRIGSTFNEIAKRNSVAADAKFMKDIEAVKKEYSRTLGSSQKQILFNYIDDITETAEKGARVTRGGDGKHLKGFIPGDKYQTFRSQLSAQGDSASDVYFGRALKGLRNALDDAMSRSVSEADNTAWNTARKQWQAMKTVKPLAEKAIDGNVSPALLLERVRANYPDLSKAGPIAELAGIGQTFLKQPIGDSGTAQRLLFQNLLTGSSLGVGAGGLTYGATQDPATAALAAGMFFGGPKALQKLYYSKASRRYLTEGLLDPQNPLLTKGPRSLGLLTPAGLLAQE